MNKQSIAFKVPYYLKSTQSLPKLFTPEIQKLIQDDNDHISIGKQGFVTLSKKKSIRSLYLTTVRKYKHKETGQIVQKIEKVIPVNKSYDYVRMADFHHQGDEKPPEDNLIQLKDNLYDKLINNREVEDLKFNVVPSFFLKSFNLAPTNTDMLINKSKNQNKIIVGSKNIGFGQEIPQFQGHEIPQYIKESKIFQVVRTYFEKRPCWLRNVLEYTLQLDGYKGQYTTNQLKNILKYFSYTFRDGPWKHTFCRFGYDPTLSVEAAGYQILLIKIKKKEVEDYQENSEEEEEKGVYDPTFKELPNKFLRLYQLCDISDKRIRQLLLAVANSSDTCSKQYGWFNKKQHFQLLRISKIIRDGLSE